VTAGARITLGGPNLETEPSDLTFLQEKKQREEQKYKIKNQIYKAPVVKEQESERARDIKRKNNACLGKPTHRTIYLALI
jgi:hypothetical protein